MADLAPASAAPTTNGVGALVHRAATIELKYRALSTEWTRRPDPDLIA